MQGSGCPDKACAPANVHRSIDVQSSALYDVDLQIQADGLAVTEDHEPEVSGAAQAAQELLKQVLQCIWASVSC